MLFSACVTLHAEPVCSTWSILPAQPHSAAKQPHLRVFLSLCAEICYLLIGNSFSKPAGHENTEVYRSSHTHVFL